MKKNILIFDYWTKAIKPQILPIINHLDHDKYNFFLVHFSVLSTSIEQVDNQIEQVKCSDFSSHSKFSISKVFNHFTPDLVLVLNTHSLIDRAIIKCANFNHIPVFYIQHGLSWMNSLGLSGMNNLMDGRYDLKRYFNKVRQYFFYFLIYLTISFKVDKFYMFKYEFYKSVIDAIFNPVRFLFFPPTSNLNVPTISFVYGSVDKAGLIKNYKYPSEKIKIIGSLLFEETLEYKDLSRQEKQYNSILLSYKLDPQKKTILFLPTISVEFGSKEITRKTFIAALERLIACVLNNDFNLIIKLHPRADESIYSEFNSTEGVYIVKDENLLKLVSLSDLIISEPSTAIYLSVLLKKIIILLRIFDSYLSEFDFVKEGVALDCRSFEQLDNYLKNFNGLRKFVNFSSYQIFSEKYCNFTKVKSSKLIANEIIKITNISVKKELNSLSK